MTTNALVARLHEAERPSRIGPDNIEAEQELIGSLLARADALGSVLPIIGPEHFAEAIHGDIFSAIREAVEAGQAPSLAIIRQHIGARTFNADLGGVTCRQPRARRRAHRG
jgi:replicative DNA helicase